SGIVASPTSTSVELCQEPENAAPTPFQYTSALQSIWCRGCPPAPFDGAPFRRLSSGMPSRIRVSSFKYQVSKAENSMRLGVLPFVAVPIGTQALNPHFRSLRFWRFRLIELLST